MGRYWTTTSIYSRCDIYTETCGRFGNPGSVHDEWNSVSFDDELESPLKSRNCCSPWNKGGSEREEDVKEVR